MILGWVGSVVALGHEFAHLMSCQNHHKGYTRSCGDVIDGTFRRLYPPRKCEGEK